MSDHYKSHPSGIEAIEITQYESFLRGNILKYVLRAPYKGDELADLEKAAEYLQWEIERVKEDQFWAKFEEQNDKVNWQAVYEKRAEINEDYYDYYRAGMHSGHGSIIGINPATSTAYNNAKFDNLAFPDKCQECEGDCKVC